MKHKFPIALTILFTSIFAGSSVFSDDYQSKSFSLRFTTALSRFSPYSDVAALGGASVGSRYGSSFNPASSGWSPSEEITTSVSPQFSQFSFSNGTDINVGILSASNKVSERDVLTASYGNATTSNGHDNDGLGVDFALTDYALKWGHKSDANLSYGIIAGYGPQSLDFSYQGLNVVHYRAESIGARAGVLYGLNEALRIGGVLDFSVTPDRTGVLDPATGLTASTTDNTYQSLLRTGLTYDYSGHSAVYLDYHGGETENDTGSLWVHRFPMGIDHEVVKGFWMRGGGVVDSLGEVSPSFGIGIYPSKKLSFDLAFQDNHTPEITKDFGRSRLYSASLSFSF